MLRPANERIALDELHAARWAGLEHLGIEKGIAAAEGDADRGHDPQSDLDALALRLLDVEKGNRVGIESAG